MKNNNAIIYQSVLREGQRIKTINFKQRKYHKKKPMWNVFKFTDNTAWVAICNCNHTYYCSTSSFEEDKDGDFPVWTTKLQVLYPFCPYCGKEYSLKSYNNYTDITLPSLIDNEYKSLQEVKRVYKHIEAKRKKQLENQENQENKENKESEKAND